MKVINNGLVTHIYPTVEPDQEPRRRSAHIVIYPYAIRVIDQGAMSPEAARELAEGLLHAAGIVESRFTG